MNKIIVPAQPEELENVLRFVSKELEANHCSKKVQMQIEIAAEEIFVNIAHYAYPSKEGKAIITCAFQEEPKTVQISFTDNGIPYNPLERSDPDITLAADDRQIGGLGIYMVKKSMDEIIYEYKENKNILTIKKQL